MGGHVAVLHPTFGLAVDQRELVELRLEHGLLDGLVRGIRGRGLPMGEHRIEDLVRLGEHGGAVVAVEHLLVVDVGHATSALARTLEDGAQPVGDHGLGLDRRAAGFGDGLVDGDVERRLRCDFFSGCRGCGDVDLGHCSSLLGSFYTDV